jgi:hypothetical protein
MPLSKHMPVEARAELDAVVGLDDLHGEGEPLQDIVEELDGGLLVELGVDAQLTWGRWERSRSPSRPWAS